MWTVILHVFFVLFIHYIGDVGIDKERIALKITLKKESLFFFKIKWLEFLETGGEVCSFFLTFQILFVFLRFQFFLRLYFFLSLLLFFEFSAYFFFDDS